MKLNVNIKERLEYELGLYLSGDSEEDKLLDKEYGPLFKYVYIRDILSDEIAEDISDSDLLNLINELDNIINGDDPRFSDNDTLIAVNRCETILTEINNMVINSEIKEENDSFVYDCAMMEKDNQI